MDQCAKKAAKMKAKYIDKAVKVYLAKIITSRGSRIKLTILARDLQTALTIAKSHESYGYADSLSIKPRQGTCFIVVEDEAKE